MSLKIAETYGMGSGRLDGSTVEDYSYLLAEYALCIKHGL